MKTKSEPRPSERRFPHLAGDLAATGGLLGLIALLCVATLLASCSWSVPADPGLHARLRGDRPEVEEAADGQAAAASFDDPGAASLYREHCGRCHEAWHPTYLRAGDWPRFVRKYGPEAGLFGENRARVLRWLQANAR